MNNTTLNLGSSGDSICDIDLSLFSGYSNSGRSGIYLISSLCDKRVYVGSAANFQRRFVQHRSSLLRGLHDNARLQNFVNKYGVESLAFSIAELCEKNELLEREQFYIDLLKPSFNICPIAGSAMTGRKHSEQTKAKLSKLAMGHKRCVGRVLSEESRKKMVESLSGRTLSEEHKSKISLGLKGNKNGGGLKGRARSEETKRKISQSKTGVKRDPFSDEWRTNIAAGQKRRRLFEAAQRKVATEAVNGQ
jgi:predicted GIY-YIG superfamily endonuclease